MCCAWEESGICLVYNLSVETNLQNLAAQDITIHLQAKA